MKTTIARIQAISREWYIAAAASVASTIAVYSSYLNGYMIAYGDAESHLNIAKRVVHSLTPGFAQLGGIWLPLPHLMMIPFVYFDVLWQTGLAGWIVSGTMYVIGCVYIYKLTYELTDHPAAGMVAAFVFASNPNLLYIQSTAMTEPVLMTFMLMSAYYFIAYIHKQHIVHLIAAAFFGFCASLSRYDGWFLVLVEAGLLFMFLGLYSRVYKEKSLYYRRKMIGATILFCTLAFAGIAAWILWDFMILKDPFYFTTSPFSAKSQQQGWLAQDMLPTHKRIDLAVLYYSHTAYQNIGIIISALAVIGFVFFIIHRRFILHAIVSILLLSPFLFNVITLYIGQSVIFIPSLTPETFKYRLFNVRYGLLMLPAAAFFTGVLFHSLTVRFSSQNPRKIFKTAVLSTVSLMSAVLIISLVLYQYIIFYRGDEPTITLADGVIGLSAHREPDAQRWFRTEYDEGLVLVDDFARTLSIIKSDIPIDNVIYIGNKPYWEESLQEPEKYASWIVIQRDDAVWKKIYAPPHMNARLYQYFEKAYTSQDVLIFRKIRTSTAQK